LHILLLTLPPVLLAILAQLLPLVVPVISSYLFKLLNKGTTWVNGLNDWVKRVVFAVGNIVLTLLTSALHVTAPGDEQSWDQTTIVGLVTAIIAMLLYDNGKSGGARLRARPS
jgi:uncharacterized BrkB/YihY/UPF0761 family membrane protein